MTDFGSLPKRVEDDCFTGKLAILLTEDPWREGLLSLNRDRRIFLE